MKNLSIRKLLPFLSLLLILVLVLLFNNSLFANTSIIDVIDISISSINTDIDIAKITIATIEQIDINASVIAEIKIASIIECSSEIIKQII